MLWVIVNPNRYRSKAAEAFSQEILPAFASPGWGKEIEATSVLEADSFKATASNQAGS
jgi:hypothetical protein